MGQPRIREAAPFFVFVPLQTRWPRPISTARAHTRMPRGIISPEGQAFCKTSRNVDFIPPSPSRRAFRPLKAAGRSRAVCSYTSAPRKIIYILRSFDFLSPGTVPHCSPDITAKRQKRGVQGGAVIGLNRTRFGMRLMHVYADMRQICKATRPHLRGRGRKAVYL